MLRHVALRCLDQMSNLLVRRKTTSLMRWHGTNSNGWASNQVRCPMTRRSFAACRWIRLGLLPTADEVRQFSKRYRTGQTFASGRSPAEREEYADYWTMNWLNILRADQLTISPQGAVAMQRWLRNGFAQNRPFDSEFATDLLTVQGNTSAEGPGSFYKILNKPDEAARSDQPVAVGCTYRVCSMSSSSVGTLESGRLRWPCRILHRADAEETPEWRTGTSFRMAAAICRTREVVRP
jgi:hypothetical protein